MAFLTTPIEVTPVIPADSITDWVTVDLNTIDIPHTTTALIVEVEFEVGNLPAVTTLNRRDANLLVRAGQSGHIYTLASGNASSPDTLKRSVTGMIPVADGSKVDDVLSKIFQYKVHPAPFKTASIKIIGVVTACIQNNT